MNRTFSVDIRDDWDLVDVDFNDRELSDFYARAYGIDENKFWDAVNDLSLEDVLLERAEDDDEFKEYLKDKFWDGQTEIPSIFAKV